MAPAPAATQKSNAKDLKRTSRASSVVSKTETDSPSPEANGSEPAYLKELQKSLRNASKKLNAASKIDATLAAHPGKSLDDLVGEKVINPDQKAQALKKPALQATIAQLEEQVRHFKDFAAQYEEKLASQKAALEKKHQEELEAVRANAIADATETSSRVLREQLLSVSKFLYAAANLRRDRESAGGAESLEGLAFEAVLFQVYAGNESAVSSMVKLIEGAPEKVQDIEGGVLEWTYSDVKQAANNYAIPVVGETETTEATPVSDPTLAHAGLTELEDSSVGAAATSQAEQNAGSRADLVAPLAHSTTAAGANAVAEGSYGSNSLASSTATDGWVEVPRDPSETIVSAEIPPAQTEGVAEPEKKEQSGGRGRGRNGRGRGRGRGEHRGGGHVATRGRDGGRRRGRGGANAEAGNGQASKSPVKATPTTSD
ncbi:hypothetical protein N7468_009816 [Penicillium chermesinum]|uniref:YAG7-like dimerisation domain-containing protein n=1 Tax=Penicillium chermesinum TaxID=63820 RepID=A0A9W9NBI9_9EURO|nr:uncharacterized protein N7468_009816 [Penicillium chermesinum]KAJ5216808.1 hypothetical protein N7468_009816 [Penicillium chermesinum]KAJ6171573.1 hypothetical protein N7470_000640 [Penicillium chermesinum]